MKAFAEFRIASHNWRPSWDELVLVDIVERHTGGPGAEGQQNHDMVTAPRMRTLVVGALEEGIGTWTEPLRTRSSSVITLSTRLPATARKL